MCQTEAAPAGTATSIETSASRPPWSVVLAPWLWIGLLLAAAPGQALTLAEAERIAVERDAMLRRLGAEAEVEAARALAESSLEPPQARAGIVNLPVDSFDFDAEDMTMFEIGISQEFAGGNRRELARRRGERAAEALAAQVEDRRLVLRREVRRTWTELAYLARAGELLAEQQRWAVQLRASARARYAAGEGSQLDLLRAGLESAMLGERRLDLDREAAERRVELARWIGTDAARESAGFVLPEPTPLPPLAELERRLEAHPSQQDYERRILAGESELDFARAERKPDWMLDLSYGLRSGREDGMSRPNMLSAMVTVGLPRLRSGRIDAGIAAATAGLRSLHEMHEDHRRELAAELERNWTELQGIDALLRVYAEELLPLAVQASEAALLALRHDRGGVEDTVTARQLVLETRLKHARLLADRAQARHDIDYLTGEGP